MVKPLFRVGAALLMASCALPTQAAPAKTKKPAPASKSKMTEIKVCPMTMAPVVGKGSGSEVVGNKRIYFCCAGCQPAFNNLPKAEKDKKIKEALAKQNAEKKRG